MDKLDVIEAGDNELIFNLDNKDLSEESLNELINRSVPICRSIIGKYSNVLMQSGVDPQDVDDDNSFVIYDSAKRFNEALETKFTSWLAQNTRFNCLSKISDKNAAVFPLKNDMVIKQESYTVEEKTSDMRCVFSILDNMKDKRASKIFRLRYFEETKNLAWRKIGERIGENHETVRKIHNKAAKELRKLFRAEEFSFDK